MELEDEKDVTPEIVQPDAEEIDEGKQPEREALDTGGQESPTPAQSSEENARFADMRRKQELDAARSELDAEKREKERLTKALEQFGYSGSAQEVADMLEAQNREIAPEQVRMEREAEDGRIADIEARYKADIAMMNDLHQVQRVNPAIKSLGELGDEFAALRFATDGLGRPLHTAESAYIELQKRKAPPPRAQAGDKDHLMTTGGAAGSSQLVDIPSDELEIYKDAFPDDSPAKLKERYNRVRKRQGV